MPRNRFDEILRFLHIANSKRMNPNDRKEKLRPMMDHLQDAFQKAYIPEKHLSLDELMVAYYGRHGCKQFIRGKLIRFGFLNFCLCTPLGYLIAFEMYWGKTYREKDYNEFGKGGRCLLDHLQDAFQKAYIPEKHLSLDELMVAYYGRHGCKQFIRGKLIRFGFLNFCLCTPLGYLIAFEMYWGKTYREKDYNEFGKGGRCLLDHLQDAFQKAYIPEKHLSLDELMVAYYGRHGCKQFIRGKLIRFGF